MQREVSPSSLWVASNILVHQHVHPPNRFPCPIWSCLLLVSQYHTSYAHSLGRHLGKHFYHASLCYDMLGFSQLCLGEENQRLQGAYTACVSRSESFGCRTRLPLPLMVQSRMGSEAECPFALQDCCGLCEV